MPDQIAISEPPGTAEIRATSHQGFNIAATNTTLLYSSDFDVGLNCTAHGWTVVDLTAEVGEFWHVEDYAGLPFGPLDGVKSLWCGARPQSAGPLCGYLALPGYGNNWEQAWCTKTCIPLDGDLDVSFSLRLDAELYYDYLALETTNDCVGYDNWIRCGPCGVQETWDGPQEIVVNESFPIPASEIRVRLRFKSDFQHSDEDGLYDSQAGAAHIDNLTVEGLPVETFDDELAGATTSNDWVSCNPPGFGASYMALFPGESLLQEDTCARNLSCVWAAINGSTEQYYCEGIYLSQTATPDGNARGQYLDAAIWSPPIALAGTGSVINLEFKVYRDMPLDALILYRWHVRGYSDASCKGRWRSRNMFYFGLQKDWATVTYAVGDLVAPTATFVEIALEIVDMYEYWATAYMPPRCHTHAPLLDDVRLYRVDISGPVWSVNDFDMFQDTFSTDGTVTGVGRADMARSITHASSPTILPGDSVVFTCRDPITATGFNPTGLADDVALGGKQIYVYVHCSDPTKNGAALTDTPASYPFKDTIFADGRFWTRIRCQLLNAAVGRFCVDLNDALFEAGDIVEFFFGATNTNGETSYCSGSNLGYVQSGLDDAARNASEFTILPVHEYFILYVDGMDGRGSQVYWDSAFDQMGLLPWIDRYDVRGPASSVGNRPASRVTNINQIGHYIAIFWDCGDLSSTLGDGTSTPDKSNDYALLAAYIDQYPLNGGVYICGDDVPNRLASATGASAVAFRSGYIPFTLTTGNHRATYGVSPMVQGTPGGPFDNPAFAGDTFFASGACPLLNDFDVMTPTGGSQMQMSYGPAVGNNGAVLSKKTPANTGFTAWVTVMLSGFSFAYIRDDETDGVMDRADHLHHILRFLVWFDNWPPTNTRSIYTTQLEQNYPNPFNPATTIAFSLAQRTHVRIDVFTVAGEQVRTILDETRPAGSYTDVGWDGHDRNGRTVASGVYFYKLTAGKFSQTRKMVLLK